MLRHICPSPGAFKLLLKLDIINIKISVLEIKAEIDENNQTEIIHILKPVTEQNYF
jgi:hypothetical protein